MPIITDPQKLSMPEQVQQNKDDIENIYKIIDGLDSLDNVVEVPNMSYILTAQELEAIQQPVAFILYNNQVYLKKKIESGIAYFDVVFSITAGTTITFNSSEIQVSLSNGALSLVNNTSQTYSKTQIDLKADITYVDAQLALKANLSGANFSGAVSAPTLKQSNANWASSADTWSFDSNNYSIENIYSRCEEINNILYAIVNVKITRINNGNLYYIGRLDITLPDNIASKIYDLKGQPATTAVITPVIITASQASVFSVIESGAPGAENIPIYLNILNTYGNNNIALYLNGSGTAISAGDVLWVSARIPLTLI